MIIVNDLEKNLELDREALAGISGGHHYGYRRKFYRRHYGYKHYYGYKKFYGYKKYYGYKNYYGGYGGYNYC